jgi:hypothetical protein
MRAYFDFFTGQESGYKIAWEIAKEYGRGEKIHN